MTAAIMIDQQNPFTPQCVVNDTAKPRYEMI